MEPRSELLRSTGAAYQRVPSLSPGDVEPAFVVPELAHLNTKGNDPGSRMAFFHRELLGGEPPRGHTPLLADRKIYAKRAVTGRRDRISNSSDDEQDDDDDDQPVASFLPRGFKLQNSNSRNHLRIVRKSAMSPLNGCDEAPSNQRRRTPAPFLGPNVPETQSSINEVASGCFRNLLVHS